MNTLLVEAWNEIDENWADFFTKFKKHLFLDHIIEDQCFTESFSFACSCWKFSLNHKFELIRAATLIISLKELLSTWLTEFSSCTDHSHSLKAKSRIYVAHEKVQFSINISAKLLRTNVNMISERNNLKIIWWNHENQLSHYSSHHIIVLTINNFYDEYMISHIQYKIKSVIINHWEKSIKKVITWCDIVWEIIYKDEFHRKKQETVQTSILIY